MKRALCKSRFKVRFQSLDAKEPKPEEILVRITECGICASDIHDLEHGLPHWAPLGHEMVGIVEKIGSHVQNINAGMPVAVKNAAVCGKCDCCRKGASRFCQNIITCIGGFATHIMAHQQVIFPLRKIDPSRAILLEPLNVALDMVKTAEIHKGDPIIIVGPGPIGILTGILCAHYFQSPIWFIGRGTNDARREIIQAIPDMRGFYDVRSWGWVDKARRNFSKLTNAKILITTSPESIIKTIEPIAPSGTVLTTIGLAANPKEEFMRIPLRNWLFKRFQLRTSFAYPNLYFEEANDFLAQQSIPIEKIVSHRFPLSKLNEAFGFVRRNGKGLVKAVIRPDLDQTEAQQ